MPELNQEYDPNSKTLVVEVGSLIFQTLSHENGLARVISFSLDNPRVRPGDVLLVLSGSDILFHGLIGSIESGAATATDLHSLLPSSRVH